MTSLAVVIPVFNQRAELGQTLDALDEAIAASPFGASIVVVDDGSTDGSAEAVAERCGATPVRVIVQENAGRFAARRRGLEEADAEYCLLIDSRVQIHPDALAYVASRLAEEPSEEVWNAHVEIETQRNAYGVFWDVITKRAFWHYFGDPRLASFGLEEFERFPKGTTCFFAPLTLLVEAFDAFRAGYRDLRNANDDTPVIRWIAARRPIFISPGFSCTYVSRSRLMPFLRHAFHRGTVFVDGHGRRESRWFLLVVAFYPLTIAWLLLSLVVPWLLIVPFALAALGGLALARGQHGALLAMACITPLYAAAHGLGMWRGLALKLLNGTRRRAA